MEQFQGPGACFVVERIIREGTDDASQEKGQSCLFVLERYCEGSTSGQREEKPWVFMTFLSDLLLLVSLSKYNIFQWPSNVLPKGIDAYSTNQQEGVDL